VTAVALIGAPGTRLRRLLLLYSGLVLAGIGFATFVVADLGVSSWDVLHQGIARRTGLSLGTVVIAVSGLVLLMWVPLRERPGFGTVSNVIVIGLVIDATLAVVSRPGSLGGRIGLLLVALLLTGVGTSMYIGAGLGSGPRDGLMTGLAGRGWPLGPTRTAIEVAVVAVGWLLGGTVGVGTVASALTIGPLVHLFLPRFAVRSPG
jgi:uncharacterized membrane protein YczE